MWLGGSDFQDARCSCQPCNIPGALVRSQWNCTCNTSNQWFHIVHLQWACSTSPFSKNFPVHLNGANRLTCAAAFYAFLYNVFCLDINTWSSQHVWCTSEYIQISTLEWSRPSFSFWWLHSRLCCYAVVSPLWPLSYSRANHRYFYLANLQESLPHICNCSICNSVGQ